MNVIKDLERSLRQCGGRRLLVSRHFCRMRSNGGIFRDTVLLLCHEGVFITNKCLGVELEGLAHKLSDAREVVSVVSNG